MSTSKLLLAACLLASALAEMKVTGTGQCQPSATFGGVAWPANVTLTGYDQYYLRRPALTCAGGWPALYIPENVGLPCRTYQQQQILTEQSFICGNVETGQDPVTGARTYKPRSSEDECKAAAHCCNEPGRMLQWPPTGPACEWISPTECDAADKTKKGSFVGIHYIGKIDETYISSQCDGRYGVNSWEKMCNPFCNSSSNCKNSPPWKALWNYGGQYDPAFVFSFKNQGLVGHYEGPVGQLERLNFKLGSGQMLKGWDENLVGFCKGAKVTLLDVPPEMAYGDTPIPDMRYYRNGISPNYPTGYVGPGMIAGGSTVGFDIWIMSVSDKGPEEYNIWKDLDENVDGKLTPEEWLAFQRKSKSFIELQPYNKAEPTISDLVKSPMWAFEDLNKDGFVSWEEFSGPKGEL